MRKINKLGRRAAALVLAVGLTLSTAAPVLAADADEVQTPAAQTEQQETDTEADEADVDTEPDEAALPELSEDYNERMEKIYTCVFRMDQHKPFTCAGVRELIKRIDPDYLTYEFISNNREEHMELLRQQRQALQER